MPLAEQSRLKASETSELDLSTNEQSVDELDHKAVVATLEPASVQIIPAWSKRLPPIPNVFQRGAEHREVRAAFGGAVQKGSSEGACGRARRDYNR